MKDSFLFLYLTFKRNGKTNLTVLFSKGFTERERSNSSSVLCAQLVLFFFQLHQVFCFSLVTLQINKVRRKLSFLFLSAPFLSWNCQSSSAPEQPPKRAGRVWKRLMMLLLYDSRRLGWLSWGGCSAEHKSAWQRGGDWILHEDDRYAV